LSYRSLKFYQNQSIPEQRALVPEHFALECFGKRQSMPKHAKAQHIASERVVLL